MQQILRSSQRMDRACHPKIILKIEAYIRRMLRLGLLKDLQSQPVFLLFPSSYQLIQKRLQSLVQKHARISFIPCKAHIILLSDHVKLGRLQAKFPIFMESVSSKQIFSRNFSFCFQVSKPGCKMNKCITGVSEVRKTSILPPEILVNIF